MYYLLVVLSGSCHFFVESLWFLVGFVVLGDSSRFLVVFCFFLVDLGGYWWLLMVHGSL